jgi:hypothetical protein
VRGRCHPSWGCQFDTTFYTAGADAVRTANFARGGRIEVGLDTRSNYFMLTPTYEFETFIGELPLSGSFLT